MVALNFVHDSEAVDEIKSGAALSCDLGVLTEEITTFLEQGSERGFLKQNCLS
jgi:hypothetical protein